jgi:uncharacterized protein (DUF362 family)/NAD-dependent dihydropyrimidine dehydrogenase PreA subunit
VSVVSIAACGDYELEGVRTALQEVLAPLGGIRRFVRAGMLVLLKPNLLLPSELDRAVTTHPALTMAVAEQVYAVGAEVLIGDSPSGPTKNTEAAWASNRLPDISDRTGARLVRFEESVWRSLRGTDYFVARPVADADVIINLPKLKTHALTHYTGAVKNLFGTIPGTRKRELHLRHLDLPGFSEALVDILEITRPQLTIMDAVWGQEGRGPGMSGTPRRYGCLAASTDPVALDTVMCQGMGFRSGQVLHLPLASARGLGDSDPEAVAIAGKKQVLDFGHVRLPVASRYLRIPAWIGKPLDAATRVQPRITSSECDSCGRCREVCPTDAISWGEPPSLDMSLCVRCLCCVEACPRGAIRPHCSFLGRLFGLQPG